ncbi:NAD-dependent epimerase/dehydratase [Diplocarpon rosae]|nr:NAD-dependent epimerase/dehydratase [Diplocarpon rosae]
MSSPRQFDILLLGATGYTGSLVAEHIAKSFPTTLSWAIAGRSAKSLQELANRLKDVNRDRVQPVIELVELNEEDLNILALKTRVLINTIGPYHRHSTPVVKACACHGTHYVDCTTETLWIKDMIAMYHAAARASGAIMIPAISLSSSPSDLVAWLIASSIQDQGYKGTSEIVSSSKLQYDQQSLTPSLPSTKYHSLTGMSGGSLASVLDIREKYGSLWFLWGSPRILSPNPKVTTKSTLPWLTKLFGYRFVPELGILTTSFVGPGNEAVVYRSAGRNPSLYGSSFAFREHIPVPSVSAAVSTHVLTWIGTILLAIPLFRSLVRKTAFKQGTGPSLDESRKTERVEFRAVGFAEGEEKPKAMVTFQWKGSAYEVSAILGAEAAGVLVEEAREADAHGLETKGKGGFLTPSGLGLPFVERLRAAGVAIEVVRL